jgi:pimeloyl-ACP methyl ester carboxylesterase
MTSAIHRLNPTGKSAIAEDQHIVLADGRKLGYSEYGAHRGLPVLGFHGTPGSRFMFRLVHEPARRLGMRIIAPERPGFGLSTFQRNRTLRDWASDIAEFANHLGLKQFGVAGISGGGPYAAACAALLPSLVTATALINPVGPLCPPEGPETIGTTRYVLFRVLPRVSLAMKAFFTAWRLMFLNAPDRMYDVLRNGACDDDRRILHKPEIRRNFLDGVSEGLRPGTRGLMQEMRIFCRPWNLPFDAVKAPVMLWQGTHDRNVPLLASRHLASIIPGCEFRSVEGAGHYWIFEQIEEVLNAIVQKMSEHLGVSGHLGRIEHLGMSEQLGTGLPAEGHVSP